MTLRSDGFCFLRFDLLARSIARLTGFITDQTLSYLPRTGAAASFAIGVVRWRSRGDDTLCRNHHG